MKIWILIAGMTAVTYLPRLIPLLSLSERPLPPFLKRVLLFIPYTALGALIIPGALTAIPGQPLAAGIGLAAAAGCAWYKGGLILSVLAGVAATFLTLAVTAG
jgi:branched-subunit amino acid transport protein